MQKLSIIVAMSDNNVIGKDNTLPWHLPADLRHFKGLTMNHPIIMGRKTHESIGRALPGRKNIVITRDRNYKAEGCTIAHSLEDALQAAGDGEVFIIGGATIYTLALPLADKLYLTRVHTTIPDGDTFFTFTSADWKETSQETHPATEDTPSYSFITYIKQS